MTTEICSRGDTQCNERYQLLSSSPATSNKNWTDHSKFIQDTRSGISKKFQDYIKRLMKLQESIDIEKTMLKKHELTTDLEIVKNMTNQELKTTLEQLGARNEVIKSWNPGLQKLVDEGNNHLIPEIRDAYKSCISLMDSLLY